MQPREDIGKTPAGGVSSIDGPDRSVAQTTMDHGQRFGVSPAYRNTEPQTALRSTVARRFMRMLDAHDRARLESLAGYRPQW